MGETDVGKGDGASVWARSEVRNEVEKGVWNERRNEGVGGCGRRWGAGRAR